GSALLYSTYMGGTRFDLSEAITVNPSGNAYVTGVTNSRNFPTTPDAFQTTLSGGIGSPNAFVSKLNAVGPALPYPTYLGGRGGASSSGIAVDVSGNAYVTGSAGASFPVTPGAFQTTLSGITAAFISKFSFSGPGVSLTPASLTF